MAKTYGVTLPIAGHAYVEVEAETKEAAIEKAMKEVTKDHLEDWDPIEQFNRGNVCYCPSPWEIETRIVDEGEESA